MSVDCKSTHYTFCLVSLHAHRKCQVSCAKMANYSNLCKYTHLTSSFRFWLFLFCLDISNHFSFFLFFLAFVLSFLSMFHFSFFFLQSNLFSFSLSLIFSLSSIYQFLFLFILPFFLYFTFSSCYHFCLYPFSCSLS